MPTSIITYTRSICKKGNFSRRLITKRMHLHLNYLSGIVFWSIFTKINQPKTLQKNSFVCCYILLQKTFNPTYLRKIVFMNIKLLHFSSKPQYKYLYLYLSVYCLGIHHRPQLPLTL